MSKKSRLARNARRAAAFAGKVGGNSAAVSATPSPPVASGGSDDPILVQAEQKVQSGLTPQNAVNVQKIVNAGLQAALAGGPNSILASLQHSQNPVHDCVVGAVNLALLLRKQSRNTMPLQALVPAALILMMKALDTAERIGMIKVDANLLAQATQMFAEDIMPKLGVTPQVLAGATAKVHRVMADPGTMERINRAAGTSVDPRAGRPTQVPPPVQGGV